MTTEREFTPISDVATLETLFDRSQQGPVLLFKHDTACPISAAAHREMSQIEGDVSLIDVERGKEIASEVEQRTGVRHQSPQVIVLRNGEAAWSASLFEIKAAAVTEATRQHA